MSIKEAICWVAFFSVCACIGIFTGISRGEKRLNRELLDLGIKEYVQVGEHGNRLLLQYNPEVLRFASNHVSTTASKE